MQNPISSGRSKDRLARHDTCGAGGRYWVTFSSLASADCTFSLKGLVGLETLVSSVATSGERHLHGCCLHAGLCRLLQEGLSSLALMGLLHPVLQRPYPMEDQVAPWRSLSLQPKGAGIELYMVLACVLLLVRAPCFRARLIQYISSFGLQWHPHIFWHG